MADWIAHLLLPWVVLKLWQLRSPKMSNGLIAVSMAGAILPDIFALAYPLSLLGIDAGAFLLPFHTPVGSLLVAAAASFLFKDKSKIFPMLVLGIASHFMLDALLAHVAGGMALLFPFNWTFGFQLGLLPSDSWIPALVGVVLATTLFVVLKLKPARPK